MMEFDEIVVKESPGLCRCCLSEGCYKDLGTEYNWMNEAEVYADMLLECFDISITQHNNGPNGPNRLICEVCITRLRDACNFKKQVMDSEKKFIDMMGRGEFRPKMFIYQAQLKCEDPSVEEPIEDADVEYLEDEIDFGEDVPKDELTQPSVSDITVSTLPVKVKRGRPRKNTPVKPEKRSKVAKVDDKAKTSKAVAKGESAPTNHTTREELRRIVGIILGQSTIMPFKWFLNRYRCFYCDATFLDSSGLKEHTKKHDEIKFSRILKRIGATSRIKWDISEISCKLCPKSIKSIEHYLSHINEAHDLSFDRDVFAKCCYIFNLSDESMGCIECGESFKFFAPLLRHVNKFHNNAEKFICDLCGLAFARKGTIKHHLRNVHSGMISCSFCDKKFNSKLSLANHRRKFHVTGKYVCHLCPESFESLYLRKCHVALSHDVKSMQFPCEQCPKIFFRKSTLMKHVSVVHLKEKFTTCHLCGYKGYDMQALRRHLASHDRAKTISCSICATKFKHQRSLLKHMSKHVDCTMASSITVTEQQSL